MPLESPAALREMSLALADLRGVLRSHPFRIFVPAAAVIVVGAPQLVHFAFRESAAMATQVGLSTAALFSTLLALLAGAGSGARDREAGIRDLILARSIPPGAYLFGKWLGITAAAGVSVVALGGVHLVAVALRGGPEEGWGPLAAALLVAVVQGGLAAAVALAFSTRLRAGPAFLAALVFLLLGHAAALLPAGWTSEAARLLLPRTGYLNLAAEAAFGPFGFPLWSFAVLHGILYTAFVLSLGTPLVARSRA